MTTSVLFSTQQRASPQNLFHNSHLAIFLNFTVTLSTLKWSLPHVKMLIKLLFVSLTVCGRPGNFDRCQRLIFQAGLALRLEVLCLVSVSFQTYFELNSLSQRDLARCKKIRWVTELAARRMIVLSGVTWLTWVLSGYMTYWRLFEIIILFFLVLDYVYFFINLHKIQTEHWKWKPKEKAQENNTNFIYISFNTSSLLP